MELERNFGPLEAERIVVRKRDGEIKSRSWNTCVLVQAQLLSYRVAHSWRGQVARTTLDISCASIKVRRSLRRHVLVDLIGFLWEAFALARDRPSCKHRQRQRVTSYRV